MHAWLYKQICLLSLRPNNGKFNCRFSGFAGETLLILHYSDLHKYILSAILGFVTAPQYAKTKMESDEITLNAYFLVKFMHTSKYEDIFVMVVYS